VLEQNVPNPFTETTTIAYNVTSSFSKAEIIFSTMKGEIIKTVQLKNSGKGQINVAASFIARGVYSYSLIVDGKVVETKKMIKQ
jgi:trimeric autotransporter adhesin